MARSLKQTKKQVTAKKQEPASLLTDEEIKHIEVIKWMSRHAGGCIDLEHPSRDELEIEIADLPAFSMLIEGLGDGKATANLHFDQKTRTRLHILWDLACMKENHETEPELIFDVANHLSQDPTLAAYIQAGYLKA